MSVKNESWLVKVAIANKDCPYRRYSEIPNENKCNHSEGRYCTLETCPLKLPNDGNRGIR